jgi:hypothetical protein
LTVKRIFVSACILRSCHLQTGKTLFLPFWYFVTVVLFVFLLIAFVRICRTILNWRGKSEHLFLVPGLEENLQVFSVESNVLFYYYHITAVLRVHYDIYKSSYLVKFTPSITIILLYLPSPIPGIVSTGFIFPSSYVSI